MEMFKEFFEKETFTRSLNTTFLVVSQKEELRIYETLGS